VLGDASNMCSNSSVSSNRRYGSEVTDAAINEALIRPRPISLTEAEIGKEEVTEPPKPSSVLAWVRYPESPIRVEARAIAWTERAVKVEWTIRDGSVQQAWVWTLPEPYRTSWDEAQAKAAAAREAEAEAAQLRRQVITNLRADGYTLAEAGTLLGLSKGRIHQLAQESPSHTATR
jgi:hypothetical protein